MSIPEYRVRNKVLHNKRLARPDDIQVPVKPSGLLNVRNDVSEVSADDFFPSLSQKPQRTFVDLQKVEVGIKNIDTIGS